MKTTILNRKGVKKVLGRRLWLGKADFLTLPEVTSGELVRLTSKEGHFLAIAYFNPKSRIMARILSFQDEEISREFFVKRFKKNFGDRQKLYPGETCFRLVHGEGDLLPGLTVDLFESVAVVQLATAGMERLKSTIYDALKEALPLKALVFKNDLPVRKEEGLPLYVEKEGIDGPFWAKIDGLYFLIDPISGQKTGFFLDQRENRRRFSLYVKDKLVFDLFCYSGAFSLYAARSGAQKVLAVDRSSQALALAEENARKNNLAGKVTFIQDEVENFLQYAPKAQAIVLDPPALIKKERAYQAGRKLYEVLNNKALARLEDQGIFLSCSCSQFLKLHDLLSLIERAALKSALYPQLLEIGLQAKDHPIYLSMPETWYLKAVFLKILAFEGEDEKQRSS
ncbi:RNA methylase [Thermodesulfatator indicus DSM 15286]|uniref:RNA methylase n=1 Tax=Thermodesulfatator indicus (strain DSM 15286 / JCM 11887 / CIR29812) TaxID=667014 RepID=F8AE11_THEID|nr:class I SAM-dependent rRNA methyltransferase [Thermodesulfatator indicus]AEH44981.1 RNA methylase [Thermodesulfatator indicus DSM 15286]